jgi:hypothetical protein
MDGAGLALLGDVLQQLVDLLGRLLAESPRLEEHVEIVVSRGTGGTAGHEASSGWSGPHDDEGCRHLASVRNREAVRSDRP